MDKKHGAKSSSRGGWSSSSQRAKTSKADVSENCKQDRNRQLRNEYFSKQLPDYDDTYSLGSHACGNTSVSNRTQIRTAGEGRPSAGVKRANGIEEGGSRKRKCGESVEKRGRNEGLICTQFEEHVCNGKDSCIERHDSVTPYQWRVKINGLWTNLAKQNTSIEKAFCDPCNWEFWDFESLPGMALRIDFLTMTADGLGTIQRLSTHSYVKRRTEVDATRWQWYWFDSKDPKNWIPYGQDNSYPPFQDVIEAKFLHDPSDICTFEIDRCKYEIDFGKMEQRNQMSNFRRKICRRPIFYDPANPEARRAVEYRYDKSRLPSGWAPMDTESKQGTELVMLHRDSTDYIKVKDSFFATMSSNEVQVVRIYRLQNLELWANYQTKKSNMAKYGQSQTEMKLFHGCPYDESIKWICSLGIDQRMNGAHGTLWGKGAYFATLANYSHRFTLPSPTDGLRRMFYATVLVGQTAQGRPDFKRPPPIDDKDPSSGLYDSCVDNLSNPSIYVVFDNSQSYPEFLIEYQNASIPTPASSIAQKTK